MSYQQMGQVQRGNIHGELEDQCHQVDVATFGILDDLITMA